MRLNDLVNHRVCRLIFILLADTSLKKKQTLISDLNGLPNIPTIEYNGVPYIKKADNYKKFCCWQSLRKRNDFGQIREMPINIESVH